MSPLLSFFIRYLVLLGPSHLVLDLLDAV